MDKQEDVQQVEQNDCVLVTVEVPTTIVQNMGEEFEDALGIVITNAVRHASYDRPVNIRIEATKEQSA